MHNQRYSALADLGGQGTCAPLSPRFLSKSWICHCNALQRYIIFGPQLGIIRYVIVWHCDMFVLKHMCVCACFSKSKTSSAAIPPWHRVAKGNKTNSSHQPQNNQSPSGMTILMCDRYGNKVPTIVSSNGVNNGDKKLV